MYYLLLIIFIIVLYKKNKDLTKENEELKLNKMKFCPQCGYDLINQPVKNKPNTIDENNMNTSPDLTSSTNINNQENILIKHTEKEIKNSLILIVGSILVILSAIVFLTTTWSITHNILKTLIIILMFFIFLAASYIAEKFLNLKQTSNAFYYIAMAYLPILFFSISLFSLFGKYFSIYGLGKYIYFTISSVIITIIYYEQSKKKQNTPIGIASVSFSFCSIIFLSLSINNNFTFAILILSIYNTILNILYQKNIFYITEEIHKKTILTITPSLIVLMIYNNIWNIIFNQVKITDIFIEILMLYNIYFVEKKINKYLMLNYIYPIYIIFICLNISFMFNMFIIKQILIIVGGLLVYIHDLLKRNKIQSESFIEILACFFILFIVTINTSLNTTFLIPSYCIMLIISFLSLIYYLNTKDENNIIAASIFSGSLMITIINIIIKNNIPIIYLEYISLTFIIIPLLIKNNNILKKSFYWVGNTVFIIVSLLNYSYNTYWSLAYIIYSIMSFILLFKEKDNIYKIFGYIYINYTLITISKELNLDYITKILSVTTVILIIIEYLFKKLNEKTNHYYIITQYSIALFLLLISGSSLINLVLIIIMNISSIFYIKYHEWEEKYLYVPYLSLIPFIYIKNIFINSNINYMYYLSLIIIALFTYLIKNKKRNIYIILFYIYTCFHIQTFTQSHYISLVIVTIGTYITYLIKTEKVKDAYKAGLYTCALILVQFILKDVHITINSPIYATYLIWIPLITRKIVKKYNTGYKFLEYMGYIIINLAALENYTSEMDGIIFVCILTMTVIISYLYKIGPVFIISLISILLNVLLLTRTFWLNIPWWLYILIIGGILIGFAIYNEINSKKDISLTDKIKNILDL